MLKDLTLKFTKKLLEVNVSRTKVKEAPAPASNTYVSRMKNYTEIDMYRTTKTYGKSIGDIATLDKVEVFPSKLDAKWQIEDRLIGLDDDGNGVDVVLRNGTKYRLGYDELVELKLALQAYYTDEINGQQIEFINVEDFKDE